MYEVAKLGFSDEELAQKIEDSCPTGFVLVSLTFRNGTGYVGIYRKI